ncbi:hypothetical protein COCMIDRAFT_106834, partial [Bipolaris oryzae ATCC 44560]
AFYDLYLHPLKGLPGPWSAKASVLWHLYPSLRGDFQYALRRMHRMHDPAIRIAPGEPVFLDTAAWKDIWSSQWNWRVF